MVGRRPNAAIVTSMCRNIRTLQNFAPPATTQEIHASSLQYVRKISGMTKPSQTNEAVFEHALQQVIAATTELLDALVATTPPKDREEEAAKARARWQKRTASGESPGAVISTKIQKR